MDTDTGLRDKTTPSGAPVTKFEMDWPLYFCNVKKQLGQNIWDDPSWVTPPGGKKAGEGVTIVHPDTGYSDHPELLKGQRLDLPRSKNFLDPPLTALDPLNAGAFLYPSHGSSTASVLMSEPGHANDPVFGAPEFPAYAAPSHQYVTGMAPKAKLIPCRVTNSVLVGRGMFIAGDSLPALTKALYYAAKLSDADTTVGVVSISIGCPMYRFKLASALADLKTRGVVVCAAAGQTKPGFNLALLPVYPGRDQNVICAAACDFEHTMLAHGHYSSDVDITAPGIHIWRALCESEADGTRVYSVAHSEGTSYAAPLVAGACALWQAHHGRTNLIARYGRALIFDLFRWALITSCDTRGDTWKKFEHGRGVLDVEALLTTRLLSKAQLEAWAANN